MRAPANRQQTIIALVAEGMKNREIAERIGISEQVVKNYLRVIFDNVGLWNRTELALWYVKQEHDRTALAESDAALGSGI